MSRLPEVVSDAIKAAFTGGAPTEQLVRDIAELTYTFGREDALLELARRESEARKGVL